MDKYTVQGQSIVFGLVLAWILIIGIIHWTGHGFAMDGDQEMVAQVKVQ